MKHLLAIQKLNDQLKLLIENREEKTKLIGAIKKEINFLDAQIGALETGVRLLEQDK